ncbi:hypothetical protein BGW41_004209 [Actinomortierella wolfii]|nr:hypothetical protein BGW41_004209 [Actinomortierella wolfii]
MGPPKWKTETVSSHTFEFINIPDFHSSSYWSYLRYGWIWLMFIKTILVMCGDIWTCCVLLISGDWTTSIEPAIDISIARWIFSGCILLSFVLVAYDLVKANRVIKSNDIAYVVSNRIVSVFYCLQKYDYFCFIMRIHSSNKMIDKLSFFVFFQLKGWKHLIVQAPRQVINIMTLVAFMRTLGFDLDRLDELLHKLPSLTNFTFYVMAFTSVVFVASAFLTLVAVLIWIPLVCKIRGNLKEYVCHKMDKRIDAIIQKTIKERARKAQMLERKLDEESSRRDGPRSRPPRPKPTLPNIDVILANTNQDDRRYMQAAYLQQQQLRLQQQQAQLLLQHEPAFDPSQRMSHEAPRRAEYQSPPPQHRAAGYHSPTPYHRVANYQSPPSHYRNLPNRKMSINSNHSLGRASRERYPPSPYQASLRSTDTASRSNHSYPMQPDHISPRPPYHNAYPGEYHGHQQAQFPQPPPPPPQAAIARQPAVYESQDEWLASSYMDLPTPGSEPRSIQCLPDSGVLPNTADAYYLAMTAPSPVHSSASYGSSTQPSPTRFAATPPPPAAAAHHRQYPYAEVYRPDKTELEHYDALYRDWSETHQRVRQARNVSVRSHSSSVGSSGNDSAAGVGSSPSLVCAYRRRDAATPSSSSSPHFSTTSPAPIAPSPSLSSMRDRASPVVGPSRMSSRASSRTYRSLTRQPQHHQYPPSVVNNTVAVANDGSMSSELISSASQVSLSRLSVRPSHESLTSSARSLHDSNNIGYSTDAVVASPSLSQPRAPQLWVDTAPITTSEEAPIDIMESKSEATSAQESIEEPLQIEDVILDIALSMNTQERPSLEQGQRQQQQQQPEAMAGDKQEYELHLESVQVDHQDTTVPSHGDDILDVPTHSQVQEEGVELWSSHHHHHHHHHTLRHMSSSASIHNDVQLPFDAQSPVPLANLATSLRESSALSQPSSSLFTELLSPPPLPLLSTVGNGKRPSLESLRSVASSATMRKRQNDNARMDRGP